MKKGNTVALLPIGVFLVIYLGLGIVFVYVLKISMASTRYPSSWRSWSRCSSPVFKTAP